MVIAFFSCLRMGALCFPRVDFLEHSKVADQVCFRSGGPIFGRAAFFSALRFNLNWYSAVQAGALT
jgi:hypothetical protein